MKIEKTPTNLDHYLTEIQEKADKIVDKFVIGYFIFGLFLAPVYQTWEFTLTISGLNLALYLISRFFTQKIIRRHIVSTVFAIFLMQHIGQMHGMAEMHFTFFTSLAILIIYQDWRVMIPYSILTIGHHVIFFYLELKGYPNLGQYFINYSEVTYLVLFFHFGIALFMSVIAGWWAIIFRNQTIAMFQNQQEIRKKNDTLLQNDEELRQSIEELQTTQENLEHKQGELSSLLAHNQAINNALDRSSLVSITDLKGNILKANENLCRVSGYTEDELLNSSHRSFDSGYHPKSFWKDMWESIRTGKTWRAEVKNRSKDGGYYWVDSIINPIQNTEGEIYQYLSIQHIITDKKESEQRLKQNLEEIRAVQESLNQAYADLDIQFQALSTTFGYVEINAEREIQKTNELFTNWLEYEKLELIGKKHIELYFNQAKEQQAYNTLWQKLEQGITVNQIFKRRTKTGKATWFYGAYSPIMDENGALKQVIKMVSNYNDQIEAQEQVKRLSLVAEQTDNGVIIREASGEVVWVNHSFEHISGYNLEEIKGKNLNQILQGKNTSPIHTYQLEEAYRQEISFALEILYYHKSGRPYWAELNGTPSFNKKGHLINYIIIFRDVTERKTLESTIQFQNDELQRNLTQITKLQQESEIANQRTERILKGLRASINYAERIQRALIPPESDIQRFYPDSFVFFLPKDIVSGDFYWITEQVEGELRRKIVVVGDCTGHGVPGAFMTMIAINLLNQITNQATHAGEILSTIPELLEKSLGHSQEVRDGMDISIIICESTNECCQKVTFAGAMTSIYYFQEVDGNQQMTVLKGDKIPIGVGWKNRPQNYQYQEHTIEINTSTSFYLFSDGYKDQFGGKNDRKLGSQNFKKILRNLTQKPMKQQKDILKKAYFDWKGDQKQIDDIVVLGIKIG